MAQVSDIRAAQIGAGPLMAQIATLRADLAARYAEYKLYRTTLNELRNLSQRDLADLGLAFADLRQVARGAATR